MESNETRILWTSGTDDVDAMNKVGRERPWCGEAEVARKYAQPGESLYRIRVEAFPLSAGELGAMTPSWEEISGPARRRLDDQRSLPLAAENARLRTALRDLLAMVIPRTGVGVTPETAAVAREGLMACLNLTEEDLR